MLIEKVIQIKNEPEEMPSGIYIPYISSVFGDEKHLTEKELEMLLAQIRQGEGMGICFCRDPDCEEAFMQLEINYGRICLQYIEEMGTEDECFYSSFDPDYLDSDEESPMQAADGQSIILMRYTMQDTEQNTALTAKCVEYFVRTGRLYPGMEWLKGWWK